MEDKEKLAKLVLATADKIAQQKSKANGSAPDTPDIFVHGRIPYQEFLYWAGLTRSENPYRQIIPTPRGHEGIYVDLSLVYDPNTGCSEITLAPPPIKEGVFLKYSKHTLHIGPNGSRTLISIPTDQWVEASRIDLISFKDWLEANLHD